MKAKFRDFVFDYSDSGITIEKGRKTVLHEFPNTSYRISEDLGLSQSKIKVQIFLKRKKDNIKKFEDLLLTEGVGKLELEKIGNFNVSVGLYMRQESDSEKDIVFFDVEFIEVSNEVKIVGVVFGPENAKGKFKEFVEKVDSGIKKGLSFVNKQVDTFKEVTGKVNDYIDRVNDQVDSILKTAENINELKASILGIQSNIIQKVGSVKKLATSISDFFSIIPNAVTFPIDQFNIFKNMFGFGKSETKKYVVNNKAVKERKKNSDNLNYIFRTASLASAYEAMSRIEFKNLEELNEYKGILESEFKDIFNNEVTTLEQKEIENGLYDLRGAVNDYLDTLSLTLPRINEVEGYGLPLNVIVFNYYGNLERFDEIVKLNNLKDFGKIEGSIKLLV